MAESAYRAEFVDDGVCAWPTCERIVDDILLCVGEPELDGWWCVEHVGDDWIGEVTAGPYGACVQCGSGTTTWLDGVALHRRCRKPWAMSRFEAKPVGAYARRRSNPT